mmetsp:Transcript_14257/g.45686  ORF Transcript_14257/g.45686 Transcript_14257/m.45686 type:complete len:139 (+) Transcript_14257:83-499(+)
MPPARPRASPRASPAAARAATRRGIVKDGPYMTREASRRLKLAIAAAQRVLADGGSSAEAAAAAQRYGRPPGGADSSGSEDEPEAEAAASRGQDLTALITAAADALQLGAELCDAAGTAAAAAVALSCGGEASSNHLI